MLAGVMKISEILAMEISTWKAKLDPVEPPDEIVKNLRGAIETFEKFQSKYTDFFLANLDHLHVPVDWFLFRAEQTLLEYWEPIKRAASHYIQYPDLIRTGTEKLEGYKAQLEIARKIPVILYFDKVPRALRMPFGPILFVGIPLTDAYRDDWTAGPHELGHQVYWNSQFMVRNSSIMPRQNQSPRRLIAKQKEEVFNEFIEEATANGNWANERKEEISANLAQWSEEIFAEIVGVKIAGEKFTNAAWGKTLNYIRNPRDAFHDDGLHPKPYLLPFIRECASNPDTDSEIYIMEVEKRIGNDRELGGPERDLMEATRIMVRNVSATINSLKPIFPPESDPFEQLRNRFPDNNSVLEGLLRPYILEGALTWRCVDGKNTDINLNFCVDGKHETPEWAKLLRIVL